MKNIKLNSKGTNIAIKANILPDDEMKKIGFTDYCKDRWCYSKRFNDDIVFNLTIPKDGSDIEIVTLDDTFCQPYDYQCILSRNPKFKFALNIKEKTEAEMAYLQKCGVLSGHKYGEYI